MREEMKKLFNDDNAVLDISTWVEVLEELAGDIEEQGPEAVFFDDPGLVERVKDVRDWVHVTLDLWADSILSDAFAHWSYLETMVAVDLGLEEGDSPEPEQVREYISRMRMLP